MNFLALLVLLTKGRRLCIQDVNLFFIFVIAVETPVSESSKLVLRAGRRGSIIVINTELASFVVKRAAAECGHEILLIRFGRG